MAIDTEDKRRIASAQGLIWIIGPVPDGSISVYNDRRHIAGMYPYAIGTNLFEAGVPGIGLNGTAAGNRVTLSAGAANATYGINDLSGAGSSNYLNFDFWFDPNAVTLNNATVYIYEVANDSGNDFVQVRLRYSGGYEVSVWAWGSGQTYEQVGGWQSVTDAEHHIEVFVQKAAATGSGSGQVEWTLDDVSIAAKTNCDPFDFLWDESRLGITGNEEANYTGAYYLDELTITFTQSAIPDTGADTPVTTLTIPVGGIRMLRLLRGDDPRYPRAYLNLSGLSGDIFMMEGGFSPGTGEYTEIWSGRSHRFDGEKLLSRSKDNSEFDLKYGLEGSSKNELFALQVDINRFFEDAALFQTKYIGERIWVEYRWNDGLDVEAPLWGDFNHYMEIITAKVPKWSDDLHTSALIAGFIEGTVAQFTCVPYGEGLRRKAMHGYGNVSIDINGIACGETTAQEFTNPAFLDPSTWNTGWSASAGLGVVQSKKPGFFRIGHSAAYLNNTTGITTALYQNVTLSSTSRHVIAFDVKKADGSAVTSDDCDIMAKGVAQTTSYTAIDDSWYVVYAPFFGVTSSATYGIRVKAGKAVYVDNARLGVNLANDFPLPMIHPNLQTAAATIPDGFLEDADFGNVLSGNFTLVSWVTPYFTTPFTAALKRSLFFYFDDGAPDYYLTVELDAENETIIVNKGIDTVNYGNTYSLSYTYNTPFHLAITQDNDTISVYADASLLGAFSAPGYLVPNGTWRMGGDTGGNEPANCAFDGTRIFGETWTNAQITLLYNSELVAKQAGKLVGVPPVLHVPSASTSIKVTQETDGMYLIGIGGDAAAKVDWEIFSTDAYSPKFHQFWIGIHAMLDPLLPSVAYIGDFNANVDTAYFGDGYTSVSVVTTADYYKDISYPDLIRGKFRILTAVRWLGATTATIAGFYHHGLTYFRWGENVSVPQTASAELYDLGVINIDYQAPGKTPDYVRVGARVTNNGSTNSVYYDYFFLMPGENTAKIISGTTADDIDFGSGYTMYIDGNGEAAVYLDSGNFIAKPLSNDLGKVVAYPDKYNLVMFLMNDDSTQLYFIDDQITITPYVTNRYKLAGGPIA